MASHIHRIDWRAQIEAVLAGNTPERIPAILRLDKWFYARRSQGNMPLQVARFGLAELENYLGLARSARGARTFTLRYRQPVEFIESRSGDQIERIWHTPKGVLRRVLKYGPGDEAAGLSPTIVEFPVRHPGDYAAYMEVIQHLEFVPDYESYLQYDQSIGCDGLPLVILGAIPFHDILLNWTGYERGFLDLYDRPDIFLEAVTQTNRVYRRMWEIVADSPAKFVMHGVNFDRQMTPPPIFRDHFLPYLREFTDEMHRQDKYVACHADGNAQGLLDLIAEAGFDAVDCFACEPLVPCTVAEARQAWRHCITIWGGLPSGLLEPNVPLEQLADHLARLYRDVAPGDRFLLGISDQAMPTSSWPHIQRVARWARDHSFYPIRLDDILSRPEA